MNSIGLDKKNIFVIAKGNGDAEDSATIGSIVVNDNTATTTISTINTYVDLNLNGLAVAGSNMERFILTNSTTGERQYIGIQGLVANFSETYSVQSGGSAQEFVFRLVRNGLALPDGAEDATELRSDTNSITVQSPVTGVKGDLFRVQVKNIDGTSNLVVRYVTSGGIK